jgi:hypothetical protein
VLVFFCPCLESVPSNLSRLRGKNAVGQVAGKALTAHFPLLAAMARFVVVALAAVLALAHAASVPCSCEGDVDELRLRVDVVQAKLKAALQTVSETHERLRRNSPTTRRTTTRPSCNCPPGLPGDKGDKGILGDPGVAIIGSIGK